MPWHSWRRPEAAEAGGGLARGDHTPGVPLASFWREVGDGGGSGGLGQLLGRGGAPGKWPGAYISLSFPIFLFLFSFSVICFDLVLSTKPFCFLLIILQGLKGLFQSPS